MSRMLLRHFTTDVRFNMLDVAMEQGEYLSSGCQCRHQQKRRRQKSASTARYLFCCDLAVTSVTRRDVTAMKPDAQVVGACVGPISSEIRSFRGWNREIA